MRKTIYLLISIIHFIGFSQNDNLEPVDGFFDFYDYQQEYYLNIKTILLKDLSPSPILRYLVKPSFNTEYILQIVYDSDKAIYSLVYRKAKKSIWGTKDKSQVEIESRTKLISAKNVELIKKLYINALNNIKYIDKDVIGTDGNTYIFSVSDYSVQKTGQTWSPKVGTKLYALKEISEKLVNKTKATSVLTLGPTLTRKIKKLSDSFVLQNNERETALRSYVKDTIVQFLNKKLTLDSFDIQRTSGYLNYKYVFNHNGKIKSVIRQKDYGVKWIENWLWNYEERKTRKKIKKVLKRLDLSSLNLETSLLLKLSIRYNKESKELHLPKTNSWEK